MDGQAHLESEINQSINLCCNKTAELTQLLDIQLEIIKELQEIIDNLRSNNNYMANSRFIRDAGG